MQRRHFLLPFCLLACEAPSRPTAPVQSGLPAVRQIAFRSFDTLDLSVHPLNTQDSARVEIIGSHVRIHGRLLGGYRTDRVYASAYQLGDTLFLDAMARGGIPFAAVNYYRYTLDLQPLPPGPLRVVATGVRTDTTVFPIRQERRVILDTLVVLASPDEPPPPQIALPAGTPARIRFLVDDSLTSEPPRGDSVALALGGRYPACPNLVATGVLVAPPTRQAYRLTRVADTIWLEALGLAAHGDSLARYGYRLEMQTLPTGQYRVVVIGIPGYRPSRQIILDTTLAVVADVSCVV